jgi:hypothetical protein
LDKIIELGGKGLLIPAVLSVLVLYAIRGLFGWSGRRSQHRKEFLELWDNVRSQDDFWLEVIVRHLVGTYLPAHIIRLALAQPNKTQALFELSELWPLVRYDPDTKKAEWLHPRYRMLAKQTVRRWVPVAIYFMSAMTFIFALRAAIVFGSETFMGWVFGVCAVIFGFGAIVAVQRQDTINIVASVGDDWIGRINRSVEVSSDTPEA